MAKPKVSDGFGVGYPNIDQWVYDEGGWIELGQDEHSRSFIRVLSAGGTVWEGEAEYPSIDSALRAADAAIATELNAESTKARPATQAPEKTPKKVGVKPKLTPVESSMISAVGYDAGTKELIAVFTSGATWRYRDVPKKVYQELLRSSSKGSYMRSCVIGVYADYQVRK